MDYPQTYRGRYVPFEALQFDIRRQGRSWRGDEFDRSFDALPEKMEATDGKVYYDEDARLKVLGALLENIGIDRTIRFGDPAQWRDALAALDEAGETT